MRMFQRIKKVDVAVVLLLLAMGVISAGCQTVNVKDTDGKPIALANVSSGAQGSKFASTSALTDGLGNALILQGHAENKDQWVAVSKDGYRSRRIKRPAEGKIEVVLVKETSSGRRYTRTRAASSNGTSDTMRYRSSPSQTTPGNNSKVTVPRK